MINYNRLESMIAATTFAGRSYDEREMSAEIEALLGATKEAEPSYDQELEYSQFEAMQARFRSNEDGFAAYGYGVQFE